VQLLHSHKSRADRDACCMSLTMQHETSQCNSVVAVSGRWKKGTGR
jgi:hypothetical protein